jgi:hypothetical protein
MLRRMEDRIRKLCAQILVTEDDNQLTAIVIELRDSLRQHIQRLRMHLADYPLVVERRGQREVLLPDIPNTIRETASLSVTLQGGSHQSPTAILSALDGGVNE